MSKQKYPQASVSTTSDGSKVVRKGRDNYSQVKANARRNKRRDQAEARQFKYDSLSTKEKLASCVPDGSKRQRARLEALLAKEKEAKKAAKSTVKK